jgi:photosystem II stability/assembly factor-like uncharacterized protein
MEVIMRMFQKSLLLLLLLVFGVASCTKEHNTGTEPTIPAEVSWKHVGPDSIQVASLAVHPDGFIFAGLVNDNNILMVSSDQGESWIFVTVPGGSRYSYIKSMAIDEVGTIYAAVFNGMNSQLITSSDLGRSWTLTGTRNDIETIACDYTGILYVGSGYHDESAGSIRMTTDRGATWSHSNLPDTVGVYSIVVSKLGTAFAVTGLGGVLRSTDKWNTWTKCDSGLVGTNLWTVAASPNGALYVSSGYSNQGVYRSSDDGLSWTFTGLNDYLIVCLVVDAKDEIIALAGYQNPKGLFFSTDNGTTWVGIHKGFNDSEWALSSVITQTGYLFIGTSSGLLRSTNSVTKAN